MELFPLATVTTKPDHRGERAISRNTIAQGRPVEFGEPVVTTLVWFNFIPREAAGVSSTRLSLRPLMFQMAHTIKTRAGMRGEIAEVWVLFGEIADASDAASYPSSLWGGWHIVSGANDVTGGGASLCEAITPPDWPSASHPKSELRSSRPCERRTHTP